MDKIYIFEGCNNYAMGLCNLSSLYFFIKNVVTRSIENCKDSPNYPIDNIVVKTYTNNVILWRDSPNNKWKRFQHSFLFWKLDGWLFCPRRKGIHRYIVEHKEFCIIVVLSCISKLASVLYYLLCREFQFSYHCSHSVSFYVILAIMLCFIVLE